MTPKEILSAIEGGTNRSGTHAHVLGSSGFGKSFFLEWLLRDAVLARRGFCFIDWHGTTYERLIRFLAYVRPRQQVVLLNPSEPRYVVGFNPFIDPGEDITTTVARRVDATVKPWGALDTKQTPTLARTARFTYHFAARAGETLPNASYLLRYNHRYILDYALSILTEPEDDETREEIEDLQLAKTPQLWDGKILSTKNRLAKFIGHTTLETFIGLKEGNINLPALIESDAIILVNLKRSGHLHPEPAQVFAALLLNEFREAAMRRAGTKKHYHLVLDEFQEYITFDIAAMFDETRKGGVHVTVAHQRLGQLQTDYELQDAIFSNCGVKVVFGGLRYDAASFMANEIYLDRINEREIKETYLGQKVDGYDREEEETMSHTVRTHDEEVLGESQTFSPRLVTTPRFKETVTSRAEWNREEKVSRLAQQISSQQPQTASVKLPNQSAVSFDVPTLKDYILRPHHITDFEDGIYKSLGALPFDEARLAIQKSREEFLSKARPQPPAKKKGDPAKAPFRKNP